MSLRFYGFLGGLLLSGCAPDERVSEGSSAVYRAPPDGRTTMAIGALVTLDGAEREVFCTATLIAPTVVLTARHCTTGRAAETFGFMMGENVRADASLNAVAERPIRAERVDESPVRGGDSGRGSDVAVVHLAEPVSKVLPVPTANLTADDVGGSFTAIGYGLDDEGRSGIRRSGTIVVKARTGKVLPALVTLDEYKSRGGTEEQYNRLTLFDEYEIVTGQDLSRTQPGPGDSGGPLLRERNGELEIVGVASYAVATSRDTRTIMGTVYATFGPETREMIDSAVAR